jgi:ADP-ribosylation factor-like protein 2
MGASLLVFNNKKDVADGMRADEVRKVSQQLGIYSTGANEHERLGLDDITTHTWKLVDSSAMTGKGLAQGIEWVLQDAKNRLFLF